MCSALAAAAAPRSFSTWAKEGRADVKYVKCAACEAAIAELHKQVAKARAGGSTSEEAIHAQIEAVCKPESDGGAWLRAVDLVEEGDALRLVAQATDGPCERECATVTLACEAALEGGADELGEQLYVSELDAAKLAAEHCASKCRKPPPPLDAQRQAGPPFRPFTDLERAQRDHERGVPPPPGVLADVDLDRMLGLVDDGSLPDDGSPEAVARAADAFRPL